MLHTMIKTKLNLRYSYSFLILCFFCKSNAQQEIQNSLYMFNPSILNPAYVGTKNALSAVLDYRQQWFKWDGAPKTIMLSLHSPLKKTAISLGFNLVNDKIGSTRNTAFYGDIGYRIRLNRKKDYLSFGIRTGIDYYTANLNKLIVTDTDDAAQSTNNITTTLFNAGAGIYYYGKKHYIGLTVPKLVQNNKMSINNFSSKQILHYYFLAGYAFKLNSMLTFKPSMQLKYTKNAPLGVDLNASFFIVDRLWIGGVYRHKAAVGINLLIYLTDVLYVGLANDFTTTSMSNVSLHTNEIMIGFDLKKSKNGFITPRYF